MPVYHAIAALSENRVIGAAGKIPWHLPDDFRWFKHKTLGGTLLMGRKTFEAIGRPLPGRRTIVLTRRAEAVPGVEVCRDIQSLPANLGLVWVCGGAEIYEQLLPKCEMLYLTRVKREVAGDTFFPAFGDAFQRDQVIHDAPDFRVERWVRADSNAPLPAPETWPFA